MYNVHQYKASTVDIAKSCTEAAEKSLDSRANMTNKELENLKTK